MKQGTKYQGITVTDKFLTVHFLATEGLAVRLRSVKIPIRDLLRSEVTDALDKAVRADLMRLWAQDDEEALQASLDLE